MTRLIATLTLCLSAVVVRADSSPATDDGKDPGLRSELLQRTAVDQKTRADIIEWSNKYGLNDPFDTFRRSAEQKAEFVKRLEAMKKADNENTSWLKELVENRGWPTRTLVGKDGANAAWLLIQHADADPKFQRKCLDLMVTLPRQEVSQADVAYLTDRVLLAEGKKQVYGTQFTSIDGKLQPQPLEDEANVDQRRAEVGLPTLAEYAKKMEEIYGGKAK
jgi:hypothetical protein